jgi:sec-independent protein translocase protein TatA
MGIGSWWHWLILLVVVLLLFGGRGKIPNLMKDLGQGINAFKKGLKENKDGEQPQAENSTDKQQSAIDRS